MTRRPSYRLDTRDKKIIGVCAGIGRAVRIDPTFVRIAFVAVPLLTFVTVWQAVLAYLILGIAGAALGARRSRRSEYERMNEVPRTSVRDLREQLDTTDRRLMAIDHHLNNNQTDALSREIEALRKEQA